MQHGAALGLGLAAMGTHDSEVFKSLKDLLEFDGALAGEAAGISMGLTMLGGGLAAGTPCSPIRQPILNTPYSPFVPTHSDTPCSPILILRARPLWYLVPIWFTYSILILQLTFRISNFTHL